MDFVGNSEEPLQLLETETKAFIGRKKSVQSKYGEEGTLLLGRSAEKPNYGKKVYFDALSPHVVFITGSRGSGKSYSLGVIAEELILRNPNVASVIIDPVGIFWSMKYPNREEKELKSLADWGLEPTGIEQTRVFIPEGLGKKVPKETYDRLFSLRPSELNVDDWCLTFGLERFSQSGLLLERAIEKAIEKYKNYSIDELIKIIETDNELNSKDRGYKIESRRAITSRLEAAKNWGILSRDGTSLAEICKKGYISVIDISFLEENVASLVIGMLSRKILHARKMITRQETMQGFVDQIPDVDEMLETEIPPTWLFIDEAHTLIPSGSAKTAATDSLIEYVKQGRRPGCSLVFATQQPSAIDTKVLSQVDLLLCHKLIFDDDLKAVMSRMPTMIPEEYKERTRFVKTLPIGICLVGDRSDETSRAFCIQTRPRFSQHEGREVKVGEVAEKIDPAKVEDMIINLIFKKVQEAGSLSLNKVEETIDNIKARYNVKITNSKVITRLQKEHACELKDDQLVIPGFAEQREMHDKIGDLKAIEATMFKEEAEKLAEKERRKKTLGFIGSEEQLVSVEREYETMFKVDFNMKLANGYSPKSIFMDSTAEIFMYQNGIKKTADTHELANLDVKKLKLLENVPSAGSDFKKLTEKTGLTAQGASKYLSELVAKGLVSKSEKGYTLTRSLQFPRITDSKYSMEDKLKIGEPKPGTTIENKPLSKEAIAHILSLLCECEVTKVETILKPVWKFTYKFEGNTRIQKIDAI